jgi:hypothetical protein
MTDSAPSEAAITEIRSAVARKSVDLSTLEYTRRHSESNESCANLYPQVLEAFQDRHGRLTDLFFFDAGAVCLTEKPRNWPLQSKWLSQGAMDLSGAPPQLVTLWLRAERLATQIDETLRGAARTIRTHAIFGIQTHLASCLEDVPKGLVSEPQLMAYERDLGFEERAFNRAAFRALSGAYLFGMIVVLPFLAVFGTALAYLINQTGLADYHVRDFVGTTVGGALGAVLGALVRLGRGEIHFSPEVSRREAKIIGASRPLIGALFGVIIYFGLISELLAVRLSGTPGRQFFALCVIAFIAGLNERFAREMLSAVPGVGSKERMRKFLEAEDPEALPRPNVPEQMGLADEPRPHPSDSDVR